jgi:hypothetical protein
MSSISLKCVILLVANLSQTNSKSSFYIPEPLSIIIILSSPPFVINIFMMVDPASNEFSINSLIIECGFYTTSSAAILFIVS